MVNNRPYSAFDELGFVNTLKKLVEETKGLYCADEIPWVIGYSGGKDSSTVMQIVLYALQDLPKEKFIKPVYVISTDTLVENPEVSRWVTTSLDKINEFAKERQLPVTAHLLKPILPYRFWVNLLGRGYPSPRPKFRWCTERLKIAPSNAFINDVVQQNGEAILVLGTRKAESQARAKTMEKYEAKRVRDKLSPNGSLPNSFVYTPIEVWSNDDVWQFLTREDNPWRAHNLELLAMYEGATESGECPFIRDISSPSCGASRFGCWVCTMVSEDKSMAAMIKNDKEKTWMQALLDFRNEIANHDDRELRDFRRMSGHIQLFHGRPIHGPYKQEVRERWLKKLLKIQEQAKEDRQKYPELAGQYFELISLEELKEIRRIWVMEKHELEDNLPAIFYDATGKKFPDVEHFSDNSVFGQDAWQLLKEICDGDEIHYQLTRELIAVEQNFRTMVRRSGLFIELEKALRKGFYENEEDAVERVRQKEKIYEDEKQLLENEKENLKPDSCLVKVSHPQIAKAPITISKVIEVYLP